MAMLLGCASVVLLLVSISATTTQPRLILTTAGIGAIGFGVSSLIAAHRAGRSRLPGVVGVLLGSFSTVVVVIALLGMAARGVSVVPLGLVAPTAQSQEVQAPLAPTSGTTTEYDADRMSVIQSASTIVYLLKSGFEVTGTFPTTLTAASGLVATPGGTVQLSPGTAMAYASSPDHSTYTLTITSALGNTAHYDSVSGQVTSP